MLVMGFSHLLKARTYGIPEQFVRQEDGERLVANQITGTPDGVAESQRLLLTDVSYVAGRKAAAVKCGKQVVLGTFGKRRFKLEGDVEMIFNRPFAATRHKYHLFDAGCAGFFNRILNQGLVHNRKHFFRHSLCGGQKAGAQTCDWKDGFADSTH
jgi:hypothetical protein